MKKASSPAPIPLSQEMDKHQHENQEAVPMHRLPPDTKIYREGENMDCSPVKGGADSLFKLPVQTKANGGEPPEWIPIKFQLIPPECPHSNEEKSELFKTIEVAGYLILQKEEINVMKLIFLIFVSWQVAQLSATRMWMLTYLALFVS